MLSSVKPAPDATMLTGSLLAVAVAASLWARRTGLPVLALGLGLLVAGGCRAIAVNPR